MSIKVGEKIPSVKLKRMGPSGLEEVNMDEVFGGKRVVLFALPGAFTPTCSAKHLPGYVEHAADIKAKGVDTIACVSVNDAFVMDAWAKAQSVGDKVLMLADGNAEFARAVDLVMDGTGYGMGERSKRYSMLVEDGVVKALNIEPPSAFDVSSAEHMLKHL